ncbi:hypothetical protein AB0M02_07090 [Actinoplanes sp. NPDC051861]|uniref:hypothetical protein n=1 Tax=Actinoplanes sp. NPDC051861 TaxID=3155170 RepID=UPI00341392C6
MNDISTALHDWAERTPAGEPPVAGLIAAGTRRRNRRRAASAGAATLALAAVVGVALTTTGGATAPQSPLAQAETSPAMELAAAATSTAGTSFRFRIDSTLTLSEWQIDHVTTTCTGAVDPVKESAHLESHPVEARLVNGRHFISKDGEHWVDRGKGTLAGFMLCGDENVPSLVASDPATALKSLRKASMVTKTAGGYQVTDDAFTGTVKVSGGKITEFSYAVDQKKTSDYPAYTKNVTMKLSGYGSKVSVKNPL